MYAYVGGLADDLPVGGQARVEEVRQDLILRVNGYAAAPSQVPEVNAVTLGGPAQLNSEVPQTFALQPGPDAGFDHQIGGALFQQACANPVFAVPAAAARGASRHCRRDRSASGPVALVQLPTRDGHIFTCPRAALRPGGRKRNNCGSRSRCERWPLPAGPGSHQLRYIRPIGAVGVITPWATTFMLSTWKIAPAAFAKLHVVHKPAEWSPLLP